MSRFSKSFSQSFSLRQWFTFGILAAGLLLFTLLSAPNNPRSDGSTYSRSPEGYGAWYAYVERSGQAIDRWEKPLPVLFGTDRSGPYQNDVQEILDPHSSTRSPTYSPINSLSNPLSNPSSNSPSSIRTTLIQITSEADSARIDRRWIEQGNRVILIGISRSKTQLTNADFHSEVPVRFGSPSNPQSGTLKIATTRRKASSSQTSNQTSNQTLVSDSYGTLVWRTTIGSGEIIHILPTFLAANAYQNEAQNFAYLQDLTQGDRILMDEYIHGYRDSKTAATEGKGDLSTFLANTPIALIVLQTLIILSVLIYGKNWRFGAVRSLNPPIINNSRAYIQALAGILQKANSTDFVTSTLSHAELKKLQRTLGLGTATLDPETILQTWTLQTGRSATEFREAFLFSLGNKDRHPKPSEAELTQWLAKIQTITK